MAKIPEIVINKNKDTDLNMSVTLTLEQLYDLMHHTHKIEDIIGSDEYNAANGIIESGGGQSASGGTTPGSGPTLGG